jgi:GAF domain-containing protein
VVLTGKNPVAVLCCEHCGEKKVWTKADETYLHQMAILLGIAFKARLSVQGA